jgi:3',5'-cyclic AMP phosphodiesterase CpdA
MRVLHLSDLHFAHPIWNPLRLLNKRLVATFNWLLNRKNSFSHSLLSALPPLSIDLVLVTGDLSTTGALEEFVEAKKFLESFRVPLHVLPGNHDHYTHTDSGLFYDFFPNQDLQRRRISAKRIDEGWWLVMLDTAFPSSLRFSGGRFDEATETSLDHLLSDLSSEKVLLANHFPFFKTEHPAHRLLRKSALRSLLEKHPHVKLYCHGHTHKQTVANLQPNGLPIVLDSGSIVHKGQAGFHLIELGSSLEITPYQATENEWRSLPVQKLSLV